MAVYKIYVRLVCLLMFNSLRKISTAYEDFQYWTYRYSMTGSEFDSFVHLMLNYPEYRYVFYYRLGTLPRHIFNVLLPKLKSTRISVKSIQGGMFICHGFSSIIVAEKIGKNFVYFQNVTVGYNRGGKPSIGNNVEIFAGAVVAGPITIGNNVKIGANAVVLQDIPDNCVVYGNPCIIKKKDAK